MFEKLESIGEYKKDIPKVAVVIVYRVGSRKLARKAAAIHHSRAGMPCVVYYIEDTKKQGWVHLQNKAFRELEFDYYVYSCDDYFPGKDYLKIAMVSMINTRKKVMAFNDGKWNGTLASAALVEKKFINTLPYEGGLFWDGYQMSYGDTELTDFAIAKDQLGYNPEAVLMEIDYFKESQPHLNKVDRKLYNERNVVEKNFK